jgi:hypothetical protein
VLLELVGKINDAIHITRISHLKDNANKSLMLDMLKISHMRDIRRNVGCMGMLLGLARIKLLATVMANPEPSFTGCKFVLMKNTPTS